MLQSELANGLASLLFIAGVDGHGRTAGDDGLLASLTLGLGAITGIFDSGLRDLVIRELFYAWVGHGCLMWDEAAGF